ncbi:hypothetical protein M404DRAFT_1002839 [Pisolithus tinctorius Marx 270]|uniref:Uncharacterized protein n=1 Tax=Pisolithus tinctorius Marx 270 TaxID=870435 RepID=A0A0C3P2H8_PISTI|nr:hypothetical protein M404DRAFT_1002839 [Pisolithus tinctorius Marx 270]
MDGDPAPKVTATNMYNIIPSDSSTRVRIGRTQPIRFGSPCKPIGIRRRSRSP